MSVGPIGLLVTQVQPNLRGRRFPSGGTLGYFGPSCLVHHTTIGGFAFPKNVRKFSALKYIYWGVGIPHPPFGAEDYIPPERLPKLSKKGGCPHTLQILSPVNITGRENYFEAG